MRMFLSPLSGAYLYSDESSMIWVLVMIEVNSLDALAMRRE